MDLVNYDLNLLKDYDYIIGIDEVGRGNLAGPLVVCGCIMTYTDIIDKVNDSKKLSEKKRNELEPIIKEKTFKYKILEVSNDIVDSINIYQATKQAMLEVAQYLSNDLDNVLILTDAMKLDLDNNIDIVKGDQTSYAIACASIIAKVYRDNLMIELDKIYPLYDFKNNKGYGTKKHLQAIKEHGYIDTIHRKTYEPIKSMILNKEKPSIK